MKKYFWLLVFIFVVSFVLAGGCTSATGNYVGKYENAQTGNTINLYSDGTYMDKQCTSPRYGCPDIGDYKIDGNQLGFTSKRGGPAFVAGTFENGNINTRNTYKSGLIYIKVSSTTDAVISVTPTIKF